MRQVTWRTPAIVLALLAAYIGVYFALGHNGRFDSDFYAWGLTCAFLAPVVTVAILAFAGSHWWENDVGLNLVFLGLATMPENGGLAWTFQFSHGVLSTPVLAWVVIGGPWWVVMASIWRFWLIARKGRTADDAQHG